MQKLISALGEIFAPLIQAIVCGGLILGFRNVIDSIQMFDNGTKTLVQISQFWAGADSFLWLIGEAIFHFLPVGICWSITKKMGTTQILGIVLGITLVSPQLLNAYSVASTAAADIMVWNFGSFTVQMIGYQGQVLPAMLAGFALVYLEKLFHKITPEVISMIVVPFMSLTIAVILAHMFLGPIGWKIGSVISTVVYNGLTSSLGWLFSAFFGFFYAPMVITGLHHMTNAIDLQLISEFQGTNLWPMITLSKIAQGSAVLAMNIMQKMNERAQQINIPACISCYLSVTEPAIFLRCQPEVWIPVRLWNDRLCSRSSHLSILWCQGQFHRCWRHPGYPVHSAETHGNVCILHVGGNCRSICSDHNHWKEVTGLC